MAEAEINFSQTNSPLVSVIIPVYKVEPYLRKCVDFVLAQTYTNLEVILVDDGSPDGCPAICDEYAKNDARIKVIHKKNGGLSDARNIGIQAARGIWIMYVDSDDYVEADAVEHFMDALERQSAKIDIAVGVAKEIALDGKVSYQRHTNLEKNRVYSAKEYILKSAMRKQFFAPAWLNLYRKEFLYKFRHNFKVGIYYEDLDILPKLFLSAENIIYTDYAFYNYIKRENSITNSGNMAKKHESAKIVLQDIFTEIETVADKELRNVLNRWFSNIYLCMVGSLRMDDHFFPKNMKLPFLFKYCFSFKDLSKAFIFGISRKLYVRIYKMVA